MLYKLLLRRHFWRYATFSEVAELYASRVMRVMALQIVAVFVSIYMYQEGLNVGQIAFIWAGFFGLKSILSLPMAALSARIGPKHGVLLANILYIPAMIGYSCISQVGLWVLIPAMIFQAFSASLYGISHNVDFSKVKNLKHAGKEIAFMNIAEKVATGLGPLVGGIIAYFFGPVAVMLISALLFALAAVPLFATAEPVRPNQKIKLRGFPWQLFMKHALGSLTHGIGAFGSGTMWSLYVAIVIIGMSSGDDVYAITGALTSVVMVMSLVASYTYGKFIDNKQGWNLLRVSILVNSSIYIIRPFIGTPLGVVILNAINEMSNTGYMMPYTRALYDNADMSGHRIAYMWLGELSYDLGNAIMTLTLGTLTFFMTDVGAMRASFLVASLLMLMMLTAKFPIYRHQS